MLFAGSVLSFADLAGANEDNLSSSESKAEASTASVDWEEILQKASKWLSVVGNRGRQQPLYTDLLADVATHMYELSEQMRWNLNVFVADFVARRRSSRLEQGRQRTLEFWHYWKRYLPHRARPYLSKPPVASLLLVCVASFS
jgi:hypothetical protein